VRLKTYSGELLETLGSLDVSVQYGEQQSQLLLIVVKGNGPRLFGRDWLKIIKLGIYSLQESPLDILLSRYQGVFEEGLGTLVGYEAQIIMNPDAAPKFCKARTVPYAYKSLVNEEIDQLVQHGILKPVTFSDWAAPIVSVLKSDKDLWRL